MRGTLAKAAFRFALTYARRRYHRQIRIAAGIAAIAIAAAVYLAGRDVPEG